MTLPHKIQLSRREDIDKKIDLLLPKGTKLILLNAPPFSGKDELADLVCDAYPELFNRVEFKFKIKELFMVIFNVSEDLFNEVSKSENKDESYPELNGLSYRNCMKMIPELMIKPNLGTTYFTEAIIHKLDPNKINLLTDNGFQEGELDVFDSRIESHELKLVLLKIRREGCNYDNDSRNETYLHQLSKGITCEVANPYVNGSSTPAMDRAKYAIAISQVLGNIIFPFLGIDKSELLEKVLLSELDVVNKDWADAWSDAPVIHPQVQ